MIEIIDAILRLLNYKFLGIFWFSMWVFLAGEMTIYTIEKLIGVATIVRWYDLAWLLLIFVMCFLIAYRLYVLVVRGLT